MNFNDMKNYELDVEKNKVIYKDKIEILLGYEVDYIKGYIDERVLNSNVDYLIGSVHFLGKWGFDNPEFIGEYKNKNINDIWQKYFDTIKEMADTQLFDIVGHLDLIKVFKFMPNKNISDIAKDALISIKNADMTLELNVAGYRKPVKEAYPSRKLLEDAFKLDIPITFGSDAHEPEQVGLYNDNIIELAKSVGYTKCVYYRNRQKKFISF
jgi:histidinol-phosphatase (PHP family)